MDKRKRLMNVQEALELLNRLSEAESDGGEVSGLSDVSWVCSASDGSSDSDPEPPRNVRPSHPDPRLQMGLLYQPMQKEILDCTIAEARRDRATWDVSIMELKAFIALLYVRGAYCGKNIEMESFWSEQWGNAFFNATLSRKQVSGNHALGCCTGAA
ncbi:hypothetical protein JOQ06_020402 [Pogonophryne albipinna]|uniref:PiggyBac transposable element-derived protein domain-containing protein n=1 Tax=Pogonophryne albipinna TaxID=1090488 RepID=A0AAD6BR00_9TELE|nr:hypothetical protein JOQ06_020402 [Pogonophryne albipinna]